jgi:hypothetical protein
MGTTQLMKVLNLRATPHNRRAMRELERRGFKFCVHFGTENAAARLNAMNRAMREGRLYEHLKTDLGVIANG